MRQNQTGFVDATPSSCHQGHRYPVEIISHCVWLYHCFPLSLREIEELVMARGVLVTSETIHQWCRKFGQAFARPRRHRLRADTYRHEMTSRRFTTWNEVVDLPLAS